MKHFFLILSFLFHILHIQICTVQITRLQIFIASFFCKYN